MVSIQDEGREALQKLMKEAEKYASFQMNGPGQCPPILLIDGVEGMGLLRPRRFSSEEAKDAFAIVARLTCTAHGATAAVFVSEAWMRCAEDGKRLDLSTPPSQAPDRREAVVLMGETRSGVFQKFLPILRYGNGKFKGFGEAPEVPADHVVGRFAQFLSPEVPTEEQRREARMLLNMNGIEPEKNHFERRSRQRGRHF